MTNTNGIPPVKTKTKGVAYTIGQAIAWATLTTIGILIASLAVWGIVSIWRAILG